MGPKKGSVGSSRLRVSKTRKPGGQELALRLEWIRKAAFWGECVGGRASLAMGTRMLGRQRPILGHVKVGIIRALQDCNGVTQWPPARAGPDRRAGLDGSLLRKLTLLGVVAARSLSNRTLGHHLFAQIHLLHSSARRHRGAAGHKVRVRPEAPRLSFRPEARGARPASTPWRASANPGNNPCAWAAAAAAPGRRGPT